VSSVTGPASTPAERHCSARRCTTGRGAAEKVAERLVVAQLLLSVLWASAILFCLLA
jgi:hypothetical protein